MQTDRQTDKQTNKQTDIFMTIFCALFGGEVIIVDLALLVAVC